MATSHDSRQYFLVYDDSRVASAERSNRTVCHISQHRLITLAKPLLLPNTNHSITRMRRWLYGLSFPVTRRTLSPAKVESLYVLPLNEQFLMFALLHACFAHRTLDHLVS